MVIIDARSELAAAGNKLKGHGTGDTSHVISAASDLCGHIAHCWYSWCDVCTVSMAAEDVRRYAPCQQYFMDIANIHAIRKSEGRLRRLCVAPDVQPSSGVSAAAAARAAHDKEVTWFADLQATLWVAHIRSILAGACTVAYYLGHQVSTLHVNHMSDHL